MYCSQATALGKHNYFSGGGLICCLTEDCVVQGDVTTCIHNYIINPFEKYCIGTTTSMKITPELPLKIPQYKS